MPQPLFLLLENFVLCLYVSTDGRTLFEHCDFHADAMHGTDDGTLSSNAPGFHTSFMTLTPTLCETCERFPNAGVKSPLRKLTLLPQSLAVPP